MNMRKFTVYIIILIVGISSGFVTGLLINKKQPQEPPNTSTVGEMKKASLKTVGTEDVSSEVTALLLDMYNNSEYVQMHKKIDYTTYPSKDVDSEMLEKIVRMFNEYEWRANQSLGSFSASDFELFIEIYTPDMAQTLTLYGGYDIMLFKDKINDTTSYFTYIFSENDKDADLAVKLKELLDK